MAIVRLFGLVLIITAMLLGLAAVTTQTTQIRFRRDLLSASASLDQQELGPWQSSYPNAQRGYASQQNQGDPSHWSGSRQPAIDVNGVEFVSVPVLFPLVAAGLLGLVFWFAPTVVTPRSSARSPLAKKKRRNRFFPRL